MIKRSCKTVCTVVEVLLANRWMDKDRYDELDRRIFVTILGGRNSKPFFNQIFLSAAVEINYKRIGFFVANNDLTILNITCTSVILIYVFAGMSLLTLKLVTFSKY
jgi:hypothetical protein